MTSLLDRLLNTPSQTPAAATRADAEAALRDTVKGDASSDTPTEDTVAEGLGLGGDAAPEDTSEDGERLLDPAVDGNETESLSDVVAKMAKAKEIADRVITQAYEGGDDFNDPAFGESINQSVNEALREEFGDTAPEFNFVGLAGDGGHALCPEAYPDFASKVSPPYLDDFLPNEVLDAIVKHRPQAEFLEALSGNTERVDPVEDREIPSFEDFLRMSADIAAEHDAQEKEAQEAEAFDNDRRLALEDLLETQKLISEAQLQLIELTREIYGA